jgi:hypothetical protein
VRNAPALSCENRTDVEPKPRAAPRHTPPWQHGIRMERRSPAPPGSLDPRMPRRWPWAGAERPIDLASYSPPSRIDQKGSSNGR